MIDRRIARWLAAATAAVLVLTADPADASISWPSAPCATGAITSYSVQLGDQVGPLRTYRYRLDGWSDPCTATPDQPPQQYQFGVILYGEDEARIGRLTTYQEHGLTTFAYVIGSLFSDAALGRLTAVCLASSHTRPISCVSVDNRTGITPIDTTDRRVLVRPLGSCGNCVTDP